jgi:hypothetical protein
MKADIEQAQPESLAVESGMSSVFRDTPMTGAESRYKLRKRRALILIKGIDAGFALSQDGRLTSLNRCPLRRSASGTTFSAAYPLCERPPCQSSFSSISFRPWLSWIAVLGSDGLKPS